MKHILKILLPLAFLALYGCGTDDAGNTPPSFSAAIYDPTGNVSEKTISGDCDGMFVVIDCACAWTLNLTYPVGAPSGWCTVSGGSSPQTKDGNGKASVWVATVRNTASLSRTAVVEVNVGGTIVPLGITQSGTGVGPQPFTAALQGPSGNVSQISLGNTGVGVFVEIKCDGNWDLSVAYPEGGQSGWCAVDGGNTLSTRIGTGDAVVWIATAANTSQSERRATVTISAEGTDIPLTIIQERGGDPEPNPVLEAAFAAQSTIDWDYEGVSVNITSNTSWIVTFSYPSGTAPWCNTSNVNGGNNYSIWVSASQNLSSSPRTATIIVTAGSIVRNLTLTQSGKPSAPPPTGLYAGRYELPMIVDKDWFLEYTKGKFAMEYECSKKHSKWVAWKLYASCFGSSGRTNAWRQDSRIPTEYQAKDNDFPSGYDKGHMCSSGERTASKEMNQETFFYSNMSPQNSDLNQGIWLQLENYERDWAQVSGDTLYICCGGAITNDQPILKYSNGLAIPKYNFKVILRRKKNGAYNAIGFWFENKSYSQRTRDYFLSQRGTLVKSVDEIEQLTGIDFFYGLPADVQTRVEQEKNLGDWSW